MTAQQTPLNYAPPDLSRTKLRVPLRFLFGFAILFAIEIGCPRLANETIGEMISGFFMFIVIMGGLVTVAVSLLHRPTAVVILSLVAVSIIPHNAWLGLTWWRVARETECVSAYAEQVKARSGAYPPDLNRYSFRDPAIAYLITYEAPDSTSFEVRYSVGTTTTAHTYSPRNGWFYYPD